MEKNKSLVVQLLIVIVGAFLFIPGLGQVHLFDWDEINFAESAREMIVTGDYLTVQINFEAFWEKPPLFTWLQVLSMKVFGINEFASRFPNAICGIITLLVLYHVGCRLRNARFGLIWAIVYACSIFPFFYFKTGIIDPWFNLFIFLGTWFFVEFTREDNTRNPYMQVALSGFFLGLAVLTKGPVGFLIFLLAFFVYLVVKRFRLRYNFVQVLLFFAVFAIVGGAWFVLQILYGNADILKDFIVYQIRLFQTEDAGHGGFPFYHVVILFFGVFPASVLALPVFRPSVLSREADTPMRHFMLWMMIVFWVVLILFSIVNTKIIHYSSMCYFPLTFMAAWYVEQVVADKNRLSKVQRVIIVALMLLLGLVTAAVPFFDKFKHLLIPYVDEFTKGNLEATASWMGFEWIAGLILIIGAVFFVVFGNTKRYRHALAVLLISQLLYIYAAMFFIVPQVEKYTQGAMIEFYKSKQGEECYILSTFKSYAPYFYAKQQPHNKYTDQETLYHGNIDKPCYFVVRNTERAVQRFLDKAHAPVRLYDKNGFVFYARYPDKED